MHAGVGIDKHTFSGEPLGAVAGDSVTVVEMAVLGCVEFELPIVIQANNHASSRRNGFDEGKIAVGNSQRFVGSRELDSVSDRELEGHVAVDADAGKPAWIVGSEYAGLQLDRKQVVIGIDRGNGSIGTGLNSNVLATPRIADHIADFVVVGPGAVGTRHVLAWNEDAEAVIVCGDCAVGLQLLTDGHIQFPARSVVR